MTRQQRAVQLNDLVKSEDGLEEIERIYGGVCRPIDFDPEAPGLTPALMIDAILETEFPTGVVEAGRTISREPSD